ncbi:CheR family methyltransferase [Calditrichota bacterium GD2]
MKKSNVRSLQVDRLLLDKVIEKIRDELGLSFADKAEDVERALINHFNEYRIDILHAKIERLLNEDLSRNFGLIDKLTISETYFFRNHKLFAVLEKEILPNLIRRKAHSQQPLTIWSAGCSSGEEAYSVAMLIDQLQKNHPKPIPARILATDINQLILNKAREGLYSNWSFRNMPVKYMEEYFTPQNGRFFQIAQHIKKMVHFEQHNLKKGPFPVNEEWKNFDIIICRNVLIYFDRETMLNTLQRFHDLLDEDGYFIAGPAEIPSLHFTKFKGQLVHSVILYRKHLPPVIKEKPVKTAHKPQKTALKVIHPHFEHKAKLKEKIKTDAALAPEEANNNFEELTLIKNLADLGNLEEARKLTQNYLLRNNLDSQAHYLLGTIYLEMGETAEAEKSFQKALYLKPDHIMAHFHLANLYSFNGRTKDSRMHFTNVLNLIQSFDPQQEIPDSEGMSAFQFKQMVEKILKTNRLAS